MILNDVPKCLLGSALLPGCLSWEDITKYCYWILKYDNRITKLLLFKNRCKLLDWTIIWVWLKWMGVFVSCYFLFAPGGRWVGAECWELGFGMCLPLGNLSVSVLVYSVCSWEVIVQECEDSGKWHEHYETRPLPRVSLEADARVCVLGYSSAGIS